VKADGSTRMPRSAASLRIVSKRLAGRPLLRHSDTDEGLARQTSANELVPPKASMTCEAVRRTMATVLIRKSRMVKPRIKKNRDFVPPARLGR
jgi:hypothetical protein